MLLAIFAGLTLTMLAAGGTPIGAAMRRWMVEKPAAKLSGIHRNTWLAMLALAVIFFACWGVIGKEGILIYAMALPELTMAMAVIDIGMMVDVALLLVATASSGGWRGVAALIGVWIGRARAKRARRTQRPRRPAANDDGEGPAFAHPRWAFAA